MKIFSSFILVMLFCFSGLMAGKQFQTNEITYVKTKNEQLSSELEENKNKIDQIKNDIQTISLKVAHEDKTLKNISKLNKDKKSEEEMYKNISDIKQKKINSQKEENIFEKVDLIVSKIPLFAITILSFFCLIVFLLWLKFFKIMFVHDYR